MNDKMRQVDAIRRRVGPIENHVIDEFAAGHIGRREFLRRGSVVGLSIPALSAIVAACGGANSSSSSSASSAASSAASSTPTTTPATTGATGVLKIGGVVPAATVNPLTVADEGGLTCLQQAGEYLMLDNPQTFLVNPVLATSWSPNADGTVWTFKLRPGVKFHNGQPMTADDVVYTFKQNCDPKNATNALSVFTGVLTPAGVTKVDATTVAFHLDAATGSFPWLISSDNYNVIVVPNNTDFSKYESNQIGTGPFVFKSYTPKVGASYTANPNWWGGKVGPAGVDWTFYATQPPQILALQGGTLDGLNDIVLQGAQSVFNNPNFNILTDHTSQHRELSMRCDRPPLNDARVRRAIALTLDRPAIINALFGKYAQLGNDNPFAPIFTQTDKTVPQRHKDIPQAKALMAAAGHAGGITVTLVTEQYQEIPELAQIIKQSAAEIGVTINLKVESQGAYYGKATFGNSDWLDGEMSLVDYGHRGVPNAFLNATLTSPGSWNAAHYKNPAYDTLFKQYSAAVDISTQRSVATKIQNLLLQDTPIIIPFFFDELSAVKTHLNGIVTTGMGQMFLGGATKG